VLPSIYFDDQLSLAANKIGEEGSYRFLSNELKPSNLSIPETMPKLLFGTRRVFA
jgi:hypothetical protein